MLFQVIFTVFFLFPLSQNTFWNPCPSMRSAFQDISIDSEGRKRPNCVCKPDLFGDRCQFKVYVSFSGKRNGSEKSSQQAERSIYPFEHLNVNLYPNSSLVVSWRHAKVVDGHYYVIQFRELIEEQQGLIDSKSWGTLAYIGAEYFTKSQDWKSFEFPDFYNYTTYEINVGILRNNDVIASVSILQDRWRAESIQDVVLDDVMFSASVTWSAWSAWGSCETQRGCGKGKQKRSRALVTTHCLSKKSEETRRCKLKSCPVNGGWSRWSLWSQCSVTCNNGTRSRLRSCISPAPKHGGKMCRGLHQMNKTCINEQCSEITNIGVWSFLKKLKRLEFTSVIVGAAAGFITCLLIIAFPHSFKRCTRYLRDKYKSLKNKELRFSDFVKTPKLPIHQFRPHITPSNPLLPPPVPPPPPAINWRPIPVQHVLPSSPRPTEQHQQRGGWGPPTHHMQMDNNLFMEELVKAFKTFNVENQFGSQSDKPPS